MITLAALQRTTWDMRMGKDMSQIVPLTEMRLVVRDTHSGTSSVDQGFHPYAPEMEARDGEVYDHWTV